MARAFTFPDDLIAVIEDESWDDTERGKIALAAIRIAQDGEMPERTTDNAAWWLILRMVRDRLVASADAIERGRRGGKNKAAAQRRYASTLQKASESASQRGEESRGKESVEEESKGKEDDGLSSQRKQVIDHLNEVTGASYRHSSNATRRHLDARLREGFTVEQLITVIDTKAGQWLNDKKMRSFLRPQTLFGSKCESYLAESAQPTIMNEEGQGWGREV